MELRVRRETAADPPLAMGIGGGDDPVADDDGGDASERGHGTRLVQCRPGMNDTVRPRMLCDAGQCAGCIAVGVMCPCHQKIEAYLPQQILGIDVVIHWVLILMIRRP